MFLSSLVRPVMNLATSPALPSSFKSVLSFPPFNWLTLTIETGISEMIRLWWSAVSLLYLPSPLMAVEFQHCRDHTSIKQRGRDCDIFRLIPLLYHPFSSEVISVSRCSEQCNSFHELNKGWITFVNLTQHFKNNTIHLQFCTAVQAFRLVAL